MYRVLSRSTHFQRTVLFTVAALQLVSSTCYFIYYGPTSFGWPEWVFIVSPVIYFLLGALTSATRSRTRSLIPVAGLLTCVSLVSYVGELNPRHGNLIRDGRMMQLFIAILLLYSTWEEIQKDQRREGAPPARMGPLIEAALWSLFLFACLVILISAYLDAGHTARLGNVTGWTARVYVDLALFMISALISIASILRLWSLKRMLRGEGNK